MRNVAMPDLRLVEILAPLHDLSMLPDADRRQLGECIPDRIQAIVVGTRDLVGLQRDLKNIADDLAVHGRSGTDGK